MEAGFFFYTYILIGILFFASAASVATWIMMRRSVDIYASVVFVVYIIELALILFDEYSRAKLSNPFIFEQALNHPLEHLALSIVFVFSCWAWTIVRTYDSKRSSHWMLALSVWAAIEIALLPRADAETSSLRQYLYWLWRDVALLGCVVYGLLRYRLERNEARRHDLEHLRSFAIATCVVVICMIAEDTYVILFYRPEVSSEFLQQLSWHLSGRNISENVLVLIWAIWSLRQSFETFQLHFRHSPIVPSNPTSNRVEQNLSQRIDIFCDEHDMSAREREVLRLLLAGKDAQNIASELCISSGTVRAHLHRIYRKTEVNNKGELVDRFWKEQR